MKKLIAVILLFSFFQLFGQNPKIITSIPGAPSTAFFSWPCNGLQFYQDYVAATNNTQIWRTDGTVAGTFPLTNFPQGNGAVYTSTDKAAVSGTIFYFSVLRSNIYELWKSDGTVNGTVQVNISPATQTTGFIIANSTHVFFSSGYSSYEDLYSVDNSGTAIFLQRLTQPNAYGFSSLSACIFKNKLVTWKQFIYGTNNNQLFISDGTVAGSYSDPVIFGSMGSKMTTCGDNFILMKVPINSQTANLVKVPGIANGGIGTPEIFYTLGDGNNLKDYNYHYSSSNQINGIETYGGNATIGNSILLSGYSDNQGWEIWKTDGTAAGTILVKDIYPGMGSGFDRWNGFVINGKFIFDAYTLISGNGRRCIFFSDGTTIGTDYFPQRPPSNDPNMSLLEVCYFSGKAYFISIAGQQNNNFNCVWQTDGSIQNTLPITPYDISPHSSHAPFGQVNNGSILYKTSDATGLIKMIAAINPNFKIWNGSANADWIDAANWENNTIPTTSDNVLIPGSAPNYPVINSNSSINSLWSNAFNATVINNATLSVNEELGVSVYNTLNGSGSVNFSGTGDHVFDGAGSANLPISLSGGNVSITGSNKTIPQLIFLGAAKLLLGNNDLSITQAGGITGYAGDRYVVTNGNGRLILPAIGTSASSTSAVFPIGSSANSYTPATVTNNGTSQQFNARAIDGLSTSYNTTYPETVTGAVFTNSSVNKTWFINKQNTGQIVNAAVQLQWNAGDELPGLNRLGIQLAHYSSNGWITGPSGAASGSGPYTYSRTGLTSFSPFGIANYNLPLPITLHNFTASYTDDKVTLHWQTSSEQNASHFIIERSANAVDFIPIGRREATGTSSTTTFYDYVDMSPVAGTGFYRLKMYDHDNTYKLSSIVSVKPGTIKRIEVFPNPAGRNLQIQLSSEWRGMVILRVSDITGKFLQSQNLQKDIDSIGISLDIIRLAPGIYLLSVESGDGYKETIRFVKR